MSPSRRDVLVGALPVALGLAGCPTARTGDRESSTPVVTATPSPAKPDRGESASAGTVRDPTVQKVRNVEGEAVIEATDEALIYSPQVVTSDAKAAELSFAPGVSDEDVADAREFLVATDYSTETVVVLQQGIRSCDRLVLHAVSWSYRNFEWEYCSSQRPPDERCVADRRETLGLFVRLPAVVDGEFRSTGSSGRSPCRSTDVDWARIDANATDAEDGR